MDEQEPTTDPAKTRRRIFIYDIVMIAVLVLLALAYFATTEDCSTDVDSCAWIDNDRIDQDIQDLIALSIWFGALGGLVISLKGVYDHGPADWQNRFNLWHLGRPISGAIVGGVTYLLLRTVSQTDQPEEAVVLTAAFVLGTQERRFFNFLYEVARLVVQTPGEGQAPALTVTDVEPAVAAPGSTFKILGLGFHTDVVVQINGTKLEDVVVAADGTAITATVPAGAGPVDVLVVNPDGAARLVSGKLTIDETAPPVPVLTSLDPATRAAGDPLDLTLRAIGANFVDGAKIHWDGAARDGTVFVSTSELTVTIAAAEIGAARDVAVKVVNPAPGNAASEPLIFAVT